MGFANTPYIPHAAENGVKDMFVQFTTGAAGVVASVDRGTGKGFGYPNVPGQTSPVAFSSNGAYTIRLSDAWQAFLGCTATIISNNLAVAGGFVFRITGVTLTGASPAITIAFTRTDTGAAANVPDNAVVILNFKFKESTV